MDGKANAAILRFLADCLGVPRSRLEIGAGASGRNKTVLVQGLGPDEVCRRLSEA